MPVLLAMQQSVASRSAFYNGTFIINNLLLYHMYSVGRIAIYNQMHVHVRLIPIRIPVRIIKVLTMLKGVIQM